MFSLYFAGACKNSCFDYLIKNKCKKLFSQYADRKAIQQWIDAGGGEILLDSGAFSVYNSKKKIDIDEMINYVNSISKYCSHIASLDVIGDAKASFENFEYIRKRINAPEKLMPTYHFNEPMEYLDKYLALEDERGKVERLALGGMVGISTKDRTKWLNEKIAYIRSKRPDMLIHVFGVTTAKVLKTVDCDSADSTTYIKHAVYGHLVLPNSGQSYHIGKSNKYISEIDPEILDEPFKQQLAKLNLTVKDLIENEEARMLFNMESMQNICNNMEQFRKEKISSINKKSLI